MIVKLKGRRKNRNYKMLHFYIKQFHENFLSFNSNIKPKDIAHCSSLRECIIYVEAFLSSHK